METKKYAIKKPGGEWQSGNHKIPWDKWKWKYHTPKSTGCNKSSSKREVHSDSSLPKEMRKMSNKQPNLPSKWVRKIRTSKTQSQQKKGNNKDLGGNK